MVAVQVAEDKDILAEVQDMDKMHKDDVAMEILHTQRCPILEEEVHVDEAVGEEVDHEGAVVVGEKGAVAGSGHSYREYSDC
mmetsp:Transcript_21156/g.48011  ORF Transcript_21156/g.48011 Transcript_21156/m.48011 type:complete len:82 (-) Transcript_21156:1665-1910(-)